MQYKIHNEGWVYLVITLIIAIIFIPFFIILSFIFFFLSFFIYYFFRDPIRSIPAEELIVSPADGIVTFIGEVDAPDIINSDSKYIKISIFLSIFNVHVNRIPCNGTIKKVNYINGKFFNASFDKSSDQNERNEIILKNSDNEELLIVQIAGLIARRIVCNIKENQDVYQGHRFGIIKFGSRVDLFIPNKYKPLVAEGQTVIGGESILANPNNIQHISSSIKI